MAFFPFHSIRFKAICELWNERANGPLRASWMPIEWRPSGGNWQSTAKTLQGKGNARSSSWWVTGCRQRDVDGDSPRNKLYFRTPTLNCPHTHTHTYTQSHRHKDERGARLTQPQVRIKRWICVHFVERVWLGEFPRKKLKNIYHKHTWESKISASYRRGNLALKWMLRAHGKKKKNEKTEKEQQSAWKKLTQEKQQPRQRCKNLTAAG